jgi:alpha-L-fucosidase
MVLSPGTGFLVRSPENLMELYYSSVGRNSNLLLNIPPDKRGLLHENDVKSLLAFRELREKELKTNWLRGNLPGLLQSGVKILIR